MISVLSHFYVALKNYDADKLTTVYVTDKASCVLSIYPAKINFLIFFCKPFILCMLSLTA